MASRLMLRLRRSPLLSGKKKFTVSCLQSCLTRYRTFRANVVLVNAIAECHQINNCPVMER